MGRRGKYTYLHTHTHIYTHTRGHTHTHKTIFILVHGANRKDSIDNTPWDLLCKFICRKRQEK